MSAPPRPQPIPASASSPFDEVLYPEKDPPQTAFQKWMTEQKRLVRETTVATNVDVRQMSRLQCCMTTVVALSIYYRSYHHAKRLGSWKKTLPISCVGMGTILMGCSYYLSRKSTDSLKMDWLDDIRKQIAKPDKLSDELKMESSSSVSSSLSEQES